MRLSSALDLIWRGELHEAKARWRSSSRASRGGAALKLGVAFGWHSLAWEARSSWCGAPRPRLRHGLRGRRSLAARLAPRRRRARRWTVTLALLAATTRIRIGRSGGHHWNTARLARRSPARSASFPPAALLHPRSVNDPRTHASGCPRRGFRRIAWLDESLDALRALWRGEEVTRRGRFVASRCAACARRLPWRAADRDRRRAAPSRVVARHADA